MPCLSLVSGRLPENDREILLSGKATTEGGAGDGVSWRVEWLEEAAKDMRKLGKAEQKQVLKGIFLRIGRYDISRRGQPSGRR